jgi:hypothetical protein
MSVWQRVRAMFGASVVEAPGGRPKPTEPHPRATAALAKADAALEKRKRLDRLDAELLRVERVIRGEHE